MTATPCTDCGTTGGTLTHRGRPQRYSGAKFGVEGDLCATCRQRRHRLLLTERVVPCDLCGESPDCRRFDGSEFDLEGRICIECRGQLQDERELARCRTRLPECAFNGILEVLTPGFHWIDLTGRARTRLEVAAAKRRARRQPKVIVPIPPATPCVTCKTTEGKLDSPRAKHVRLEGTKFGAPGLHCGACYARLYRPTRTLSLIGVCA